MSNDNKCALPDRSDQVLLHPKPGPTSHSRHKYCKHSLPSTSVLEGACVWFVPIIENKNRKEHRVMYLNNLKHQQYATVHECECIYITLSFAALLSTTSTIISTIMPGSSGSHTEKTPEWVYTWWIHIICRCWSHHAQYEVQTVAVVILYIL